MQLVGVESNVATDPFFIVLMVFFVCNSSLMFGFTARLLRLYAG
jgi:hypothetical protein